MVEFKFLKYKFYIHYFLKGPAARNVTFYLEEGLTLMTNHEIHFVLRIHMILFLKFGFSFSVLTNSF